MNETAAVRRHMCASCLRPQSACICRWVVPSVAAVEVLILQHPLEVNNSKGSARLLHLCLPGSRLAVGEQFDEAQLRSWLTEPWTHGAPGREAVAPCRAVLLYPEAPGDATGREENFSLPGVTSLPREPGAAPLRLVVLDATWRKSRKMLFLNPLLQSLPRLALQDPPPSRYLVRKAHLPHQLSTMEAACEALMRLEGDRQKFQPLLRAFDGFISQQLSYRPAGEDRS